MKQPTQLIEDENDLLCVQEKLAHAVQRMERSATHLRRNLLIANTEVSQSNGSTPLWNDLQQRHAEINHLLSAVRRSARSVDGSLKAMVDQVRKSRASGKSN